MCKTLTRLIILTITLQTLPLWIVSHSEARDLTDVLGEGLDFFILPDEEGIPVGAAIAPSFAGTVAQAVAYEIPLASVAPAFTYRYNPAVDTFERSTNVPGPLFSERALTLGDGQLNLGVGYSFVDFSELNGRDVNNLGSPAVQVDFSPDDRSPYNNTPPGFPPLEEGQSLFSTPFSYGVGRIRLKLQVHAVVLTFRYGLTEKWDVGLTVPIVHTFLRATYARVPVVEAPPGYRYIYVGDEEGNQSPGSSFFFVDSLDNRVPSTQIPLTRSRLQATTFRATGHSTGVGDITLRSKYQFWRTEEGGAAFGLTLQLPSGEKRNFHGTGDTRLGPSLYLSQVALGRVEPHLNLGLDLNADDVDRSSFLYAVGASLLLGNRVGLVVDVSGRSEFAKFPLRLPPGARRHTGNLLNRPPGTCTEAQPCTLVPDPANPRRSLSASFPFFPKVKRNDIINVSFGVRYVLRESGSLFFGGVMPLNSEGFRADFIPSGGIEYTF